MQRGIMGIKHFAILALAGGASAQMSSMDHASMSSIMTADDSLTASMPSMSSFASETTSMAMETMSDHTMPSATMVDTSSTIMTHHSETMGDMPMATGGVNATASAGSFTSAGSTGETQVPALGGADVVSGGISLAIFLVSMGLTAMIQL
ncbi:hypothetical protein GGR52DRAFT_540153 [Hypoxylon sp. FL1284]|nr:hypothetical protein GGR52DRAFT_540153 [Hypoxylon sp. FL1284]